MGTDTRTVGIISGSGSNQPSKHVPWCTAFTKLCVQNVVFLQSKNCSLFGCGFDQDESKILGPLFEQTICPPLSTFGPEFVA